MFYRLVKTGFKFGTIRFFIILSLQNVNQIESSADSKPAVYLEPENENEQQKVAPPKVLQVQQVQHHEETKHQSNVCRNLIVLTLISLLLFFVYSILKNSSKV